MLLKTWDTTGLSQRRQGGAKLEFNAFKKLQPFQTLLNGLNGLNVLNQRCSSLQTRRAETKSLDAQSTPTGSPQKLYRTSYHETGP